jgi:hypothetical protein
MASAAGAALAAKIREEYIFKPLAAEKKAAAPKAAAKPERKPRREAAEKNEPSGLAAFICWLFLGWLGGHRLYTGKYLSAVIQLSLLAISCVDINFSRGACSFLFLVWVAWMLIDLFLIISGAFTKSDSDSADFLPPGPHRAHLPQRTPF